MPGEEKQAAAGQLTDVEFSFEGPEVQAAQLVSIRSHVAAETPGMKEGEVKNFLRLKTAKGEFHFALQLDMTDQVIKILQDGQEAARQLAAGG
jgi:hypothetical protein